MKACSDANYHSLSKEFPNANSYKFLYAKYATRGKDDPAGHGTRVASRIVGTKYGLAKNVHLVFVKVDLSPRNAWPSVIDALGKVSDYIMDEGVSSGRLMPWKKHSILTYCFIRSLKAL